jgi:hypothetical protein
MDAGELYTIKVGSARGDFNLPKALAEQFARPNGTALCWVKDTQR